MDDQQPLTLSALKSSIREQENGVSNNNICICQRCFRLQQYGQVEASLRPGWSKHELLTPERFESLLSTVKENPAVVLCIVDVFDLRGSLLPNLRKIAGKNPLVVAVNKVDLLPKDVSHMRVTDWLYQEVRSVCGYQSPKEVEEELNLIKLQERRDRFPSRSDEYGDDDYDDRGDGASGGRANDGKMGKRGNRSDRGHPEDQRKYAIMRRLASGDGILKRSNVHLVSCDSGMGLDNLLSEVMELAGDHGNKVYVMGAANVGKSSFINRLLTDTRESLGGGKGKGKGKGKKGASSGGSGELTRAVLKTRNIIAYIS